MNSERPSVGGILVAIYICLVTWPLAALLVTSSSPLLTGLGFVPFIIGLFAFMAACGGLWRRVLTRAAPVQPSTPPLPGASCEVPDYPPGAPGDDDNPALVPSGSGDDLPPKTHKAAREIPRDS